MLLPIGAFWHCITSALHAIKQLGQHNASVTFLPQGLDMLFYYVTELFDIVLFPPDSQLNICPL